MRKIPAHWPDMKRAFDLTMKQGRPAVDDTGNCAYLTDEGLKCAVGQLLPDGHEAQYAIGSAWELHEGYPDALPESCRSQEAIDDLIKLQQTHDNASDRADFRKAFREGVRIRLPDFYGWMEGQDAS